MSQVRDHLNPGLLEGDLLGSVGNSGVVEEEEQHVQSSEEETYSADNNNITHQQRRHHHHNHQRTHNNSSEGDEGGGKNEEGYEEETVGGHDSDPPIENQNPEDGDGVFEEVKHFVEDGESGEGDNGNPNRKKSGQFHHRKRKNSVRNSDNSYVPPYKKNRFRRQVSVLPSKFLLGGNIRDPLNLASLADAKVNAELNRETPKSSPMPVPSQQQQQQQQQQQGQLPDSIPNNDSVGQPDPTDKVEDTTTGMRQGKHKRRHRRRHGRNRTDSECSVSTSTDAVEEEEEEDEGECKKHENRKRLRKHSGHGKSFETSDDDDCDHSDRKQPKQSTTVAAKGPQEIEPPLQVRQPVTERKETVEKVEETKDKSGTSKESEKKKEENCDNSKNEQVEAKEPVPSVSVKIQENGHGNGSKDTPKVNGVDHDEQQNQTGVYPCKSSEYVPLSSSYAPSPYIFDTMNAEDGFEVKPFESPSLTNYCCNAATPSHLMEPFSPPPRPEIPHFQRRMQMMSSIPHRHPEMSLQRAVFQKPFYRRRFRHKSDPIVSPVIPQPGCGGRRNHHHHHSHNHRHGKKGNDKQGNNLNTSNTSTASNHSSSSKKGNPVKTNKMNNNIQHNNSTRHEIKNFRPKDEIYQFGNYKQYYGYRTTSEGDDSRLWIMKKEWFREKDVLDIGCNIGHVTLSIARDFEAKRVHGIDIDNNLITTARKNIKHYMIHDPSDKSVVFPHSLPMIYGAMQPPCTGVGKAPQQFPFNVMFSQENYVLSNNALLDTVKPEYDVIICLSVTKWIHLNFGDEGLKRFFRRMFRHLRKGGKLILEPQEWSSYYRKRKLTAKISDNYKNIKFMPDQFQDFLVNDVGFTFIQRLGTPHHSKGFQRPILIFCKESKSDSPATDNAPSGNNEVPS